MLVGPPHVSCGASPKEDSLCPLLVNFPSNVPVGERCQTGTGHSEGEKGTGGIRVIWNTGLLAVDEASDVIITKPILDCVHNQFKACGIQGRFVSD